MPQLPKPSNSQIVSQPEQASPKTLGSVQVFLKKLTKLNVLIVTALILLPIILFDFQGKPFPWLWKARGWTGFGESVDKNSLTVKETGAGKTIVKTITTDKLEPAKTIWDWMGLLLAPATLAGLGFWFEHLQTKAADAKAKADLEATAYQAEQVRERAADQQREEALQNYLNSLSELLVDKQLKKLLHSQLEKSEDNAAASTPVSQPDKESEDEAAASPSIDALAALGVIKARTLSLLRMFDQDIPRQASVLSFLGDADLLTDLNLDLSRSDWENADLKRVNLSGAKLNGANLKTANLKYANLNCTDLSYADLSGADLSPADLSGAKLNGADLRFAYLSGTDLTDADLTNANLQQAQYTDKSTSQQTCKLFSNNYPCPTIFPPNFDPKAAGMKLVK